MEALKDAIKLFFRIALTLFLFAFVWWIVRLVTPAKTTTSTTGTSTVSSVKHKDWLPSPKRYNGLFGTSGGTTAKTNTYVAAQPYSYTGTANTSSAPSQAWSNNTTKPATLTTYTADEGVRSTFAIDEKVVIKNPSTTTQSTTPVQKSLYIRNLSIYQGGHVYTGLSFIGEAKAEMFRDGKFPIVVVDQKGAIVGVTAAVATTNWTIPGWVKFQTKINYTLPNNVPCTMVFEGALTAAEQKTTKPARIPLPITCN